MDSHPGCNDLSRNLPLSCMIPIDAELITRWASLWNEGEGRRRRRLDFREGERKKEINPSSHAIINSRLARQYILQGGVDHPETWSMNVVYFADILPASLFFSLRLKRWIINRFTITRYTYSFFRKYSNSVLFTIRGEGGLKNFEKRTTLKYKDRDIIRSIRMEIYI